MGGEGRNSQLVELTLLTKGALCKDVPHSGKPQPFMHAQHARAAGPLYG
jgi:hypothetical protein